MSSDPEIYEALIRSAQRLAGQTDRDLLKRIGDLTQEWSHEQQPQGWSLEVLLATLIDATAYLTVAYGPETENGKKALLATVAAALSITGLQFMSEPEPVKEGLH